MWVRLTPGPLLVATSLACASAAYEQLDQPAGDTIGFEEAIGYTLERNPGLVAFGYQLDAQRGRLQQSALKPNLELDMELENAAGSGPFSGMGAAEATISLVWVLERGKRERRVDVAQAGLSLLESEAEIGRLDAAAATARLYLESLANQLLTEKADEAVRFGERTVEAVRERVGAGRTPAAELSRAEARLSEQRLIREDYRHRLRTSLRQLAAQWGDTNPSFKGVVETNASIPEPIAYEPLLQKIERNPSLTRFLSERRLREAEVRLAETRAKPDWRVSAGVRHLELTGDQALLARIRIPLPARNRNQGLIAEARAALAMTEADRRASRIEIETRLFAVVPGTRAQPARRNDVAGRHPAESRAGVTQGYFTLASWC